MKKLTRMLLMTLVLTVGASLTSCGDVVIESTDTPAPKPEPTPEPEPEPNTIGQGGGYGQGGEF